LLDVVVADKYLQMFSNRIAVAVEDDIQLSGPTTPVTVQGPVLREFAPHWIAGEGA
jgi:hypothetical protein